MTWQLRRAQATDLDAIMALETSTFTSDAWSSDNMLSDLTSAHCYYLVAFDEADQTELAGYAGLLAPRGSADGDIQTIAVSAASRRRGLGSLLMRALLTEARKRGVTGVFLEVRADNPGAERLYRELGFARLGIRPNYYQPDNVDAIVMKLAVPALGAAWTAVDSAAADDTVVGSPLPDSNSTPNATPAEASDEQN